MKIISFIIFILALNNLALAAEPPKTIPVIWRFTWDDLSENETGFIVEMRKGDKSYLELIRVAHNIAAVDILADALAGQRYCFAVSSFNAVGQSNRIEACATAPEFIDTISNDPGNPKVEGTIKK